MRLSKAIDLFESWQAEDGCTKATRDKYCRDVLRPFAGTLDPETTVADVDRDDVRLYLKRWADKSPSTRALYATVFNVFFDHAVEEGWRPEWRPLPRPRRLPYEDVDVVTVDDDDVGRLFAACEEIDEFLAIAILAYTGVRRRAAANLRWRDLDFKKGFARFREKGGKPNVQPLADELREILYGIGLRGEVPCAPDDFVIPNRRSGQQGRGVAFRSMAGRERSPKVVYKLVKAVAERAGIPDAHPHSLRAAFAVHHYEGADGNLIATKELLNHARVETTMVYLRRHDKAKAKETVRSLSWASQLQPSSLLPPAGFEPAFPPEALPDPLRSKLAELRERSAKLRQEGKRAGVRR